MESNKLRHGFDESHQPDKPWLLAFLSSFNPGLDLFKKEYVPPPKPSKVEH